MSNDLRHIISNLRAESSRFNATDVLVNAKVDHHRLFPCGDQRDFDLKEFPTRILSEARLNLKETGVNTLCMAKGTVKIDLNGKEVLSPLVLFPIQFKINRVQQTISFEEVEDSAFINPFIAFHLREELTLELPKHLFLECDLDAIVLFCSENGLRVDQEACSIGNFHHHRYQVLKELEELEASELFNPALSQFFGDEREGLPKIDLSSSNLFPADTDHERVFSTISGSHAVIQGPPGTGKSQVICNLIGKAIHLDQEILVVSEKYAALEVIQSKLAQFGLDRLCFIAGSDRQSHDLLSNLKETWDFFESYLPSTEINLKLSEQYEANLQMTLDLLAQPNLIGGVSFHEFHGLSLEFSSDGMYSSRAPSISDFIESRNVIEDVFTHDIHINLPFIRKRTLESDSFLAFDQSINSWLQDIRVLQEHFNLETWNDLSLAMKDAAVCQIFENDLFKRYSSIFEPNSKAQRQFERLSKKYNSFQKSDGIGSEWKIYPSALESKSLLNQVNNASFMERIKVKKRWRQLSNLPFSEANLALKKRLLDATTDSKIQKCIEQFAQIGITDPTKEIEQVQHTLALYSEESWSVYGSFSHGKRSNSTRYHVDLNRLHSELLNSFKLDAETNLVSFLESTKHTLSTLLAKRKNLLTLESIDFESMKGCASFSEYASLIFTSNYTIFKERFPAFSEFQPSEISEKVNAILAAQEIESRIHAEHLLTGIHEKFSSFHELLNTPANRLNPEQKAVKKELKKGKSILVKEFGKTRSHPALRELFQSEARHWIKLLKPIWLSNPSSLAKCFPMEQNSFDLVIFDEASQLPIQHALGAIQRSKRVVVAGDEHQMGPTSYFQSGSKDVQDLLHQANYYFPKSELSHHYRSVHPRLIAFSNAHFYAGKLTAYPSYQDSESKLTNPLQHHFIENAKFVDRINTKEAKAIVARIKSKLEHSKSLGIVAFSEEQLNCIWKELSEAGQDKLIAHQEKHGGFFKALENVQGDECDCLIIGFGYAPNETGDFHLRFGPMNTANGRKRLNVLLTRARESIDFFCSVRSSDFKLSDNESINLLRQWIAFSEQSFQQGELIFPYGLSPKVNGASLVFDRIQTVLPNARELATLHNVLEKRGWKVSYS